MSIGETSGIEKSVKAGADLADEYLIAKFGADDDTLVAAAAAGDKLVGVFQGKVTAGKTINVMLTGVTSVKCGTAVERGDMITSDAAGKAKPTTTAKNYVVGVAMASGVDGDIIPMLLSQSVL